MATITPSSASSKYQIDQEDVLASLLALPSVVETIGDQVLLRTTCVNVYGNKWRVNLWVSINNPVVPNAGRILKSYFIRCSNLSFEVMED